MHKFKIDKLLGKGSFGKVELATHNELAEKVAIKTISKNQIKNKHDIIMINKEISVFKAASHINIVKLYEIIEDQDNLHLVMEYAGGGDLLNFVQANGSLSEGLALNFIEQLANAVRYLHEEKQIAHRDIKLANILLSSTDNIIKLADFGLSNFYSVTHQFLETSCGSPCYSSPEVIEGKVYCPISADIWSLGVVLYAMIEGSLPFFNENVKELYKQVARGQYMPPIKSSFEIQELLNKTLAVNPNERITISKFISEVKKLRAMTNSTRKISIPLLLEESNDYIENMKTEIIKKILAANNFESLEISKALRNRKEEKRALKFNCLNTFIELLEIKPFNKLKEMCENGHINNEETPKADQKLLNRTSSNFTRDSAKDSPRIPHRKSKPKFIRSSGRKEENGELIERVITRPKNDGHLLRRRKNREDFKEMRLERMLSPHPIDVKSIEIKTGYIKMRPDFSSATMNLLKRKGNGESYKNFSNLSLSMSCPKKETKETYSLLRSSVSGNKNSFCDFNEVENVGMYKFERKDLDWKINRHSTVYRSIPESNI